MSGYTRDKRATVAPPAYLSLAMVKSKGMLWPVCKFDLILATLSALTSVPAHHLPLFNE